ncbi:MAG: translation initiation factor IF-2, partial [Flavobacterium sp.]
MAEVKTMRLSKVLREFNISLDRAVEFLSSKGYEIEARPTTKITAEEYEVLFDEFQTDKSKKVASKEVGEEKRKEKEELRIAREKEQEEKEKKSASKVIKAEAKLDGPKQVGKIELDDAKEKKKATEEIEVKTEVVEGVAEEKPKVGATKTKAKTTAKEEKEPVKEAEVEAPEDNSKKVVETNYQKLDGPNFTGKKIDLSQFKKPEKKKEEKKDDAKDKEKKSRRRRISKEPSKGAGNHRDNRGRRGRSNIPKEEPSEEEVQ